MTEEYLIAFGIAGWLLAILLLWALLYGVGEREGVVGQ